jgi:hypothetical protein
MDAETPGNGLEGARLVEEGIDVEFHRMAVVDHGRLLHRESAESSVHQVLHIGNAVGSEVLLPPRIAGCSDVVVLPHTEDVLLHLETHKMVVARGPLHHHIVAVLHYAVEMKECVDLVAGRNSERSFVLREVHCKSRCLSEGYK